MPSEFTLLLATDSSDGAFEAMYFLPRVLDLQRVRRAKALLLAWPDDDCEPVPEIEEPELERFQRFLDLLKDDGAVIEAERASGTGAEHVLAEAEAIGASMIVLALASGADDDRWNPLAAELAVCSSWPVLTLRC